MKRVVALVRMDAVLLLVTLATAALLVGGVALLGAARPAGAAPSAGEGKILFYGGAGLETMNPDGSDRSSFSPSITGTSPEWSADGTKFVYMDYSGPGGGNIVISSADGAERTTVPRTVEGIVRNPTLSPDGTRVAFAIDDYATLCHPDTSRCVGVPTSDIYTMNVDGSAPTRLDSDVPPEEALTDLDWSPDGNKIALTHWDAEVVDHNPWCQECVAELVQSPEVYTVNADGTGQPVGFADPVEGLEPAWSPDGSKIAYFGTDWDLHIMNADGTGQSGVTTDGYYGLHERDPAWSPTGTRLVFSASDLYTIGADGSNRTNITNTDGWGEYNPSWQPVFDTTAPKVDAVSPASGKKNVIRGTSLTATFSEKMDPDSVSGTTFKLYKVNADGSIRRIANAPVTLSEDGLTATLDPYGGSTNRLAPNTRYMAVVTSGARDLSDNALDQNATKEGNQPRKWAFVTGSR